MYSLRDPPASEGARLETAFLEAHEPRAAWSPSEALSSGGAWALLTRALQVMATLATLLAVRVVGAINEPRTYQIQGWALVKALRLQQRLEGSSTTPESRSSVWLTPRPSPSLAKCSRKNAISSSVLLILIAPMDYYINGFERSCAIIKISYCYTLKLWHYVWK